MPVRVDFPRAVISRVLERTLETEAQQDEHSVVLHCGVFNCQQQATQDQQPTATFPECNQMALNVIETSWLTKVQFTQTYATQVTSGHLYFVLCVPVAAVVANLDVDGCAVVTSTLSKTDALSSFYPWLLEHPDKNFVLMAFDPSSETVTVRGELWYPPNSDSAEFSIPMEMIPIARSATASLTVTRSSGQPKTLPFPPVGATSVETEDTDPVAATSCVTKQLRAACGDEGAVNNEIVLGFTPNLRDKSLFLELLILVDRSGSMRHNVASVRTALTLLLGDLRLPEEGGEGYKLFFNIVGFGSKHMSLFPSSREFTEETLAEASLHVGSLQADMGGTNLYDPLHYCCTCPTPVKGMPRQIFIITDGCIGNAQETLQLVRQHSASSRVCTLGVGHHTSFSLVRGLATCGNGKAAFIQTDDHATISKTVLHLLHSTLRPAISDIHVVSTPYRLPEDPTQLWQLTICEPIPAPPVFSGDSLTLKLQAWLLPDGYDTQQETVQQEKAQITLEGLVCGQPTKWHCNIDFTSAQQRMPMTEIHAAQSVTIQTSATTKQEMKTNFMLTEDVYVHRPTYVQVAAPASAAQSHQTTPSASRPELNFMLEAAVIRIAKAHTTIAHQELVQQVIEQVRCRFLPTPKQVKRAVEDVIARGYLERQDAGSYQYLA
eukprot:TRINITY_DN24778_c0_g1_i1.p1 TRINITY_DN24778_c0_g1~~TRINITY_DN24778_c0_g1_i1.p1  ORF type:complete len:705 (+),score=63.60 TRINITY_DN24778_c0_g1_i1:131-2116(+)